MIAHARVYTTLKSGQAFEFCVIPFKTVMIDEMGDPLVTREILLSSEPSCGYVCINSNKYIREL